MANTNAISRQREIIERMKRVAENKSELAGFRDFLGEVNNNYTKTNTKTEIPEKPDLNLPLLQKLSMKTDPYLSVPQYLDEKVYREQSIDEKVNREQSKTKLERRLIGNSYPADDSYPANNSYAIRNRTIKPISSGFVGAGVVAKNDNHFLDSAKQDNGESRDLVTPRGDTWKGDDAKKASASPTQPTTPTKSVSNGKEVEYEIPRHEEHKFIQGWKDELAYMWGWGKKHARAIAVGVVGVAIVGGLALLLTREPKQYFTSSREKSEKAHPAKTAALGPKETYVLETPQVKPIQKQEPELVEKQPISKPGKEIPKPESKESLEKTIENLKEQLEQEKAEIKTYELEARKRVEKEKQEAKWTACKNMHLGIFDYFKGKTEKTMDYVKGQLQEGAVQGIRDLKKEEEQFKKQKILAEEKLEDEKAIRTGLEYSLEKRNKEIAGLRQENTQLTQEKSGLEAKLKKSDATIESLREERKKLETDSEKTKSYLEKPKPEKEPQLIIPQAYTYQEEGIGYLNLEKVNANGITIERAGKIGESAFGLLEHLFGVGERVAKLPIKTIELITGNTVKATKLEEGIDTDKTAKKLTKDTRQLSKHLGNIFVHTGTEINQTFGMIVTDAPVYLIQGKQGMITSAEASNKIQDFLQGR